jgi:hypothetical protein
MAHRTRQVSTLKAPTQPEDAEPLRTDPRHAQLRSAVRRARSR